MNRIGFCVLIASMCVACGGGGGRGGAPGVGGFSDGIYVMQNSIQDMTSMSDMAGLNWVRHDNRGAGQAMTMDEQGRLYTVSLSGNFVRRYDTPDDLVGTILGSTGSGVNQFSMPSAIAIDEQGRIHVADGGNRRLVRFDTMSGSGWTTMSLQPFFSSLEPVMDIAFDSLGRILMVSRTDRKVLRVDNMLAENALVLGDDGPGITEFDLPTDIWVDSQDRIYVSDTNNNRIVRFNDMAGFGWTTLGTLGDGVKQFNSPVGVMVDSLGRIYTFDNNNSRIVRVDDMTGAGWTTYGVSGVNGVGEFASAVDVYIKE